MSLHIGQIHHLFSGCQWIHLIVTSCKMWYWSSIVELEQKKKWNLTSFYNDVMNYNFLNEIIFYLFFSKHLNTFYLCFYDFIGFLKEDSNLVKDNLNGKIRFHILYNYLNFLYLQQNWNFFMKWRHCIFFFPPFSLFERKDRY